MKIKLWFLNKFKRKKKNNEIDKLKERIDKLQSISIMTYRKTLKNLFNLSCMFFLSSVLCIIFFLIFGISSIVLKALSIFGFITLFPMLILLYVILYGKHTLIICSYCRRIKYDGKFYVLEDFIGNLSHDMCATCAKHENSIGMIEKMRQQNGGNHG